MCKEEWLLGQKNGGSVGGKAKQVSDEKRRKQEEEWERAKRYSIVTKEKAA